MTNDPTPTPEEVPVEEDAPEVPKDELEGLVDESTTTESPYLEGGFDGIQDDAFADPKEDASDEVVAPEEEQ